MFNLNVRLDTSAADRLVGDARRQIPFALSRALNETAKLAQLRAQTSLLSEFSIAPSRVQFFRRMIKIPPGGWATKTRLFVDLTVTGPNAAPSRDAILKRHHRGGTFRQDDALHPFFIPSKALRPTETTLPPSALYPKNLRLQDRKDVVGTLPAQVRVTKSGRVRVSALRPDRPTAKRAGRAFFVVPFDNPKGRTPGIYMRKGKERGDIELLWRYRKQITLKPRLPFERDVRTTFERGFGFQFRVALERALATARPR